MASYVLYARKSTESEDRQVLSIPSQIAELEKIAAREGVRIGKVLTESKSAKAPGRPVFGQLIRGIFRGEIQGVLCWKMDRLARNHLDTGHILQALADGKLERVITSDRTYTRDGNDRFMGSFELGMATKFIDDLRANVTRGIRARLERGWVNYRPPLGYINDKAQKTIVKDPERFDLVRRMWDLLLTGAMRPDQIRRAANEDWGFRTRRTRRGGGKLISRSVFYAMFANPFYAGIIRWRDGRSWRGGHPPMITLEEFDRVQELLGRPGRARPKRHEFTYAGLIRCGNCGGAITAEEHVKPNGRRYVYYRCSRMKSKERCPEPPIPEAELERQVVNHLQQLAMPPEVIEWACGRVRQAVGNEHARREEVRSTLTKALDGVRRQEETLLSLRLRELVDDATYTQQRASILEQRSSLELRLAKPSRSQEEVGDLALQTFEFAARARESFLQGTPVQRRTILEAIGLNYSLRARNLALEFKNPLRLVAEAGSCSNWCTTPDDVRTWFETSTEYFSIPRLDIQLPRASLPTPA